MPPHALDLRQESRPRTDFEAENDTKIILFMIIFSSLALAAVALRIVSKWMQWARLAWDDVLLLFALAQMLTMNVLFVLTIKRGGLGRHVSTITDHQLAFFMKMYFIAGVVMPTCYATAKLSMLWLLYTTFSFRNFRKIVRFLGIVVMFYWIAAVVLDTFICYPINARWNSKVKGTCSNKVIQVEYFATPIPWIITDFAILIAPLPSLWVMKVSRARQIGLITLFGFGIATCAVACKRYVTLLGIDDEDITYGLVEPVIWTMVESSTTIICAALPASTPALKRVMPTAHLTRFIEYVEDQFYAWKDKSTDWRNSARNMQAAQAPVEPPGTSAPTSRLDLTPI
ncbi:hypothetical protein BDV96DRAFT_639635 [Lophiotrema nucula]|uniref:Rhodopsin domain-containing protein n=1 Tax=Lophiotrema nucula TaxID=690887 RepID=A0A6A5ZXH3_9PLEO|nr:hypothetical protein BDV96DRAFT_639635 [Lophiotrema nucula]